MISIPYGAIKRKNILMSMMAYIKFQFLMVRLKGSVMTQIDSHGFKFQFLMVRLKAAALATPKWLKFWLYD